MKKSIIIELALASLFAVIALSCFMGTAAAAAETVFGIAAIVAGVIFVICAAFTVRPAHNNAK